MTTPPSDPFGTPPPDRPGEPDPQRPPSDPAYGQQPPSYPSVPPPPIPFEPAAGPAPQPPQPLRRAVLLMYAGAALSAVALIFAFGSRDSIREQVEDTQDLSADDIDAAVNFGYAFVIIVGLIAIGLWIWMAETNRRGKSWARIVATVLGGLNIVLTLFSLSGGGGVNTIFQVVTIALAGVILWLLYRPDSSQFYAAMSGPPR
ncbi:MAG: hypothetical protein ACRDWI_11975 [Jiangellaceae bacterium]